MEWLLANKEWVFSGIGVLALSLLIGFFQHKKNGKSIKQRQRSGANSTNIQVGGDLKR